MAISGKLGTLHDDGSHKNVHPAEVRGALARARKVVFVVLLGVMVAAPWIRVGGHPLILLDVAHRRFFLFGRAFGAGDGFLAFFLVTGLGFGLVAVTTLWGRVFCGWACPQTVFVEGVYRRLERLAMGKPEARRRLDAAPWSGEKVARTTAKHALYLGASLFFSHVVLGYFVPVRGLVAMLREGPVAHPEAFLWVMGATALLHFDFGWFREQFCTIMCPYGRLQGLMTDERSINVAYDTKRGEPRGKVSLRVVGAPAGDCIDCRRCVTVCPTGIDIRDGNQLECIGCTACIDACDEMMLKVERPTGLIRYASDASLRGEPARWLRPRLLGYAAAGVVGLVVATFAMTSRTSFDAVALRPQGAPFAIDGDEIRNPLRLRVTNKDAVARTFDISVTAPDGVSNVVALPHPTVAPGQVLDVPVLLSGKRAVVPSGAPVDLRVTREGGEIRVVRVTFLAP